MSKAPTRTFYDSTIPSDWKMMELGEMTTLLTNGFVGKAKEHYVESDDGVIYIQGYNVNELGFNFYGIKKVSKSFHEKNKKSCLEEGDLLTIQTGDIGVTTVVPKELVGANCHALVISRFKKDIAYPYFFLHYFNSELGRRKLKTIETGSTMKHLNVGDMVSIELPLPPLPEQKAIADILSTWNAAIEKTQKTIVQLQERNNWLKQQLLSGKKRLKEFKKEKWREIHIKDVSKEVSIKNRDDKQLTVLSCTKHNGLVPSLEYFGRKIFSDDVSTYKVVPKNHFAYATNHIEEGSIGYQEIFDEALISPMYTVFKTDSSVNDNFFFKLLKSHHCIYQYQNRMEGSIDRRGGLRWDAFSIIKVRVPNKDEQTAILKVLQEADKEIQLLKMKLGKLIEQKKGLMQQLLTGKKRLKVK